MATARRRLRDLEAECVARCHEHGWLSAAGTPNYRLVHSHPSTFRRRADLLLLGIHPRGDASLSDVPSAEWPYRRRGYTALLDETWAEAEPGARHLQTIAREIAGIVSDDPEQMLRRAAAGNMIPFRSESISRLPDPLRKQGLSIGARLVGMVSPRVLVLMGGDRVLFGAAVSGLPVAWWTPGTKYSAPGTGLIAMSWSLMTKRVRSLP